MSLHWFHIQFGTYGAWLPGDPRGFRSRGHRIHSSGHYRSPPPKGEHAGLHDHAAALQIGPSVRLDALCRRRVCSAIVRKAADSSVRLICVAVGRTHAHVLGQFESSAVREQVGRLKRHSSHAIRDQVPGRVWSARCHVVRIRSRSHQVAAFRYIEAHGKNEGAAVWTFRDGDAPRS